MLDQTEILSKSQCLAMACTQIRNHIRPINACLCPGDTSGEEPVISIGFFLIDLIRQEGKDARKNLGDWVLVSGRVMVDGGYETRVWARNSSGHIVDLCPSPQQDSLLVSPEEGFERYFEKKVVRGSVDRELYDFWTGKFQPKIAGSEKNEDVRARYEILRLSVANLVRSTGARS